MEPNSAFFKRSLQVVDRFLQTAVVIDDRAFRREERVEVLPQLLEEPPTPSTAVPFGELPVQDSARDTPQQLRLIIVYTGATDLLYVVDRVEERLKNAGSNPVKDGDFAFRAGAVRVVVLGKPSNYRGGESKDQQVANHSEIASRAAMEFAVMTAGLVSNVALRSLAEIRRATHRLLSPFGPHLDS